jgi:hypothetical protein
MESAASHYGTNSTLETLQEFAASLYLTSEVEHRVLDVLTSLQAAERTDSSPEPGKQTLNGRPIAGYRIARLIFPTDILHDKASIQLAVSESWSVPGSRFPNSTHSLSAGHKHAGSIQFA